jgi:hypothetical protein
MRESSSSVLRSWKQQLDELADLIVLETEKQAASGVRKFGIVLIESECYAKSAADSLTENAPNVVISQEHPDYERWPPARSLVGIPGLQAELKRRGLNGVKVIRQERFPLYRTKSGTQEADRAHCIGNFACVVAMVNIETQPHIEAQPQCRRRGSFLSRWSM